MAERSDTKPVATIPEALKRGLEHQRAGRFGKAETIYRRVLARRPNNPHALHLLGVVAHQVGKNDTAVELIGKAIARNAEVADYHSNLGMALKELDRFDEAEGAHREALRLNPDYPQAHNNLGVALGEQGRTEEALAAYREALRLNPDFAEAHNNLGGALRKSGRPDEAETAYRDALRAKPDYAEVYLNVTSVRTYESVDDDDVAAIRGLLKRPECSESDRLQLNFALGTIHDQCALYDPAFALFREANRARRKTTRFDAPSHAEHVGRIIATFGAEFLTRRAAFGSSSEAPVFVVGLSRSGKTLVESLIADHPQVHGAGELLTMPNEIVDEVRSRLGTTDNYLDCVGRIDEAMAATLAERYEARLRRNADGDVRRICDTLPVNLFHLGLIALLFPKARVIHCRRDPLDTCLAIYFKYYGSGNHYAYDLSDVGAYYRQYQRVMDHWRDVLPLSIHEVEYEDLVADPEGAARGLIDFLGLDWDDRCLPTHQRAPIHARLVNHSRGYASYLAPLKQALGIE